MTNYNTTNELSFGLTLMKHLGEGNISVSPASIRTALSMLSEGATGETAKEIANVAALPYDNRARQAIFRALTDALNTKDAPYTLRCANGIWTASKHPINDDFRTALRENYNAEASEADFQGNPAAERAKINQWVSKKTEEKIQELFPADSINPLTILVLANALYLKAPWENKFDTKHTQKQPFYLSNGKTAQVDMMRKGIHTEGQKQEYMHFSYDGINAIMLPYEGKRLASIIMLPPKNSDVNGLENYLADRQVSYQDLARAFRSTKIARLEIPKHELKSSFDLEAPLKAIGINRIFSAKTAELDGIAEGPLFVNKAVHKTYFKTNEEGSEGAAATGFAVSRGIDMSKPIEFVADRPFLETIVDTRTGAVLFINRIEDPR